MALPENKICSTGPVQFTSSVSTGIGIRVLIGQYLALRQPPVENYVGIICSVTSPYEIVKRAIDDAAFMCTRKYGDAPEVIMSGRLDLTFPYVPTHLREYASIVCGEAAC